MSDPTQVTQLECGRQHPDLRSALWPFFTVPSERRDRGVHGFWGARFSVRTRSWQRNMHLHLSAEMESLPLLSGVKSGSLV